MSKKTKYPHCALAWKVNETGVLLWMRLLTPDEFLYDPQYQHCSWGAYRPEGIKAPPSDVMTTNQVDLYGLEAMIFDKISNLSKSVAPGVLNRLQTDLRRFRINGWDLEPGGYYYDQDHREMIESASYVETL